MICSMHSMKSKFILKSTLGKAKEECFIIATRSFEAQKKMISKSQEMINRFLILFFS